MQSFNSSSRTALVILAAISGFAGIGQAQDLAHVEKIQRTVEKQTGGSPKWFSAKSGTALDNGESVRTGKRSKTDIRFADKSLLRLGQLSSLELNGPREVRLLQGQLLFSALSPARILAGSAVAAIKGTVPLIQVYPNGDADFTLYIGSVTLTTPQGTRELLPGQIIHVKADGSFSTPKAAAPFKFMNGGRGFDLLTAPKQEPFVGSDLDMTVRDTPDRQLFDSTNTELNRDANSPSYNPLASPRSTGGTGGTGGTGTPTPTPPPTGTTGGIAPVGVGLRTLAAAEISSAAVMPATGEEHLDQVDTNSGSITDFDTRLLGGSSLGRGFGDGNLLGGRLGLTNAKGRLFTDLALTPVRLRLAGKSNSTAVVTQAFMLYRADKFDLSFGRQQILDGPVQASAFGSMLHQGGRYTFDAVRFTTGANSDLKLDLVYLVDANPRLFTNPVPGRQRGMYGRIEKRDKAYAVGLNLLKFTNAGTKNTTGITGDFAIPLLGDTLEAYGELGRDSFRRHTRVVGMNFPVLYNKTGFDLFLEAAKLGNSSNAFSPGKELAARVYKQVGANFNLLGGVSKFQGTNTRFVVGVTIGGTKTERDDVYDALMRP